MSVDKDTVRRIAKLARIALDEERVEPMVDELNGILAWVEQLQEVDVDGRRADDERRRAEAARCATTS